MTVSEWRTRGAIKEWKWREAYDDEQTTKDFLYTRLCPATPIRACLGRPVFCICFTVLKCPFVGGVISWILLSKIHGLLTKFLSNILPHLEYLLMVLEGNSFLMPPESQVIIVFNPAISFLPPHPKSWIQLLLYPWGSGKGQVYTHHARFGFFHPSVLSFFHTNNVLVSCLKKKCRHLNTYTYIYVFIYACTHTYKWKKIWSTFSYQSNPIPVHHCLELNSAWLCFMYLDC